MPLSSDEIAKRFEIGVQRGVARALAEHKSAGRPIHVSKNGKIVEIQPEEIEVKEEYLEDYEKKLLRQCQMQEITAKDLIQFYDLSPLPFEGGFYKETYRAQGVIPKEALETHKGDRHFSTAIYFLLPKGVKSKLHRIKSDELWHFYLGGPLHVVQLFPGGKVEEIILGNNIKKGELLQHVVPAGCWFGAYPNENTDFSFVGCTVAPGFDFADFELADKQELSLQFPHVKDIIHELS